MFFICTLGLLLGMLVPFCEAYAPRIVVRMNQAGLDYVAQMGRNSFQTALKMRLPDFLDPQEGYFQHAPVFVLDNDIPYFSLEFIPNYGIHLSAVGHVNMTIFLMKNLQKLKVDINIMADIVISQASIGSPLVSVSFCKPTIEEIQITYREDRLKELWNPLQRYIRTILPDKLCSKVYYLVEGLNIYMGTLIGLQPLGPESQIRYSLIDLPAITKEHMSLNFNMTLCLLGKPIVLPPRESSFSLPQQVGSKNAMVNIAIPKEVFESVCFLMEKSGSINLDITGQLNSKNNQLTTSVLGNLIPEIHRQLPKSMAITIKARVNTTPTSMIHSNKTSLSLHYSLEVLAISSNSAFKSLFSLDMAVEMKLNMSVSGVKLQANVSLLKDIELKVTSSNVGTFDLSKVKPLIISALKNPVMVHLNGGVNLRSIEGCQVRAFVSAMMGNSTTPAALFGLGATLPTLAQVNYVTPEIFVYEDYAVVSCGLHFQK